MNEYIQKEEAAEQEKAKKQPAKKSGKKLKANAFVQILNGDYLAKEFVVNNLPFVFFLLFLMLMLIGKGYYAKNLVKEIDTAQKQLDATSAEFVEAKAKLEEETRRSELVEQLGPRGLKETTNPAKVIRIKQKN